MKTKRIFRNAIGIVFVLQCFKGNFVHAKTLPRSIQLDLSELNSYSPLEPAYSLGEIGFSFGYVTGTSTSELLSEGDSKQISTIDPDSGSGRFQSIAVAKGFPAGISAGLQVGQIAETKTRKYGAHLQWTAYEGFRRPSVALRLAGSRAISFTETDIKSLHVALLTDYSFGIFTPYLGMQRSAHRTDLQAEGPGYLTLAQRNGRFDDPYDSEQTWSEEIRFVGLRMKLVSIYFWTAFEWQQRSNKREQLLLKLAFGT